MITAGQRKENQSGGGGGNKLDIQTKISIPEYIKTQTDALLRQTKDRYTLK